MKTTYASEKAAALAFAEAALPLTAQDGLERCALITCRKGAYRLSRTYRGLHNNVIAPSVWLATLSLFLGTASLIHTHPHCACHNGEQFSGSRDERGRITCMGDVCVPAMGRIRSIYLAAPSGVVSKWDGRSLVLIVGKVKGIRESVRFSSKWNGLLPDKKQ